jgi:hypothetical protein
MRGIFTVPASLPSRDLDFSKDSLSWLFEVPDTNARIILGRLQFTTEKWRRLM